MALPDLVDPQEDPGGFYSRRQERYTPEDLADLRTPDEDRPLFPIEKLQDSWDAFVSEDPMRAFINPDSMSPQEYEFWSNWLAVRRKQRVLDLWKKYEPTPVQQSLRTGRPATEFSRG